MNEKIAHQIEKEKTTLGVEVEMNNIKRDKAARLAARFLWNQEDTKIQQAEMVT